MLYRNLIFTGVFAALLATSTTAQAFDDAKYPDLSGQWVAVRIPGVTGQPAFDPTKPWGRGDRSEERRVGKECEDLCRSRWSPYH